MTAAGFKQNRLLNQPTDWQVGKTDSESMEVNPCLNRT